MPFALRILGVDAGDNNKVALVFGKCKNVTAESVRAFGGNAASLNRSPRREWTTPKQAPDGCVPFA